MGASLRVLVTGADGFVGAAVTRELLVQGCTVMPTGRRAYPGHSFPGYRMLDVTDRSAWDLMPDCDVVVHCAGVFGPAVTEDRIMAVNVGGTQAAADWARSRGVGRLVLASSGGVYGPGIGRRKETDAVSPRDVYARSKCEAERIAQSSGADAVVLRLYFPVGPEQSRGFVVRVAERILAREPIKIRSDGGPVLTLTDVRDAVRCLGAAAMGVLESGVYNVGGSRDYSISEVVERASQTLAAAPVMEVDDSIPGDWRGDSSKVEAVVGSLSDAGESIVACVAHFKERRGWSTP